MAKRRIVKMKARELTDVSVDFLSIVGRGANRAPFRITKSEDGKMFNLSNIFFRKGEEKTPKVVAAIVNDGTNQEAVISALRKHYDVVDVVNHEQAKIVKFDEGDIPEDADIVKMSEDMAACIVNIEKGLVTYPDSDSFMDNMQGSSFLPSVRMASEILMETLMNVVWSDGDQATTLAKIDSVLGEYREYVNTMVGSMPVQLFKMDSQEFRGEVVEVQKGLLNSQEQKYKDNRPDAEAQTKAPAKDEGKSDKAPEGDATGTDTGGGDAGNSGAEGDESGEGTSQGEGEGEGEKDNTGTDENEGKTKDAPKDKPTKTKKSEDGGSVGSVEGLDDDPATSGGAGDNGTDGIAKSDASDATDTKVAENVRKTESNNSNDLMSELTRLFDERFKSFEGDIKKSFEGVDAKVGDLTKQLGEVSSMAKSADEAVRGTVHTDNPEGTDTGVSAQSVRKSEGDGGMFDDILNFPGFESRG